MNSIQLKHLKELNKQDTYESYSDLLTIPDKENVDPSTHVVNTKNLPQLSTNIDFKDTAMVFFDLETLGLKETC